MVLKTKGPQIRCISHGSLGLSSINVNRAAKGHAGWQKSLQRKNIFQKNKRSSNAFHSAREDGGPAQFKSNCKEHAGSDKRFNTIFKANQSTDSAFKLEIALKLAHLVRLLEKKTNSCTRVTQFRATNCKYKVMTSLPKYGALLTPKYDQKCKF